MDLGLAGHVALVTAASRGIGLECSRVLAQEGAKVAMAARSVDTLREHADEISRSGGDALPLPLDLTDHGSITASVQRVVDEWGRLDILVANTPGPPSGPVEDVTVDQWRETLEVHVVSMVHLLQQVVPNMRRQGRGRIFFVATIGVRTAQPKMVLSNASRLALMGVAKTLSIELAGTDILVNVLAPGPIATDRMDELAAQTAAREGITEDEARQVWLDEVPLGRIGKPDDLATLVALLSSDRCSYTTGAVIPVDGGKARGY